MTTTLQPAPVAGSADHRAWSRVTVVVVAAGLLALLMVASMFIGSGDIPPAEVWQALLHDSGSSTDLIVREYRAPRTLLAVVVGAAV